MSVDTDIFAVGRGFSTTPSTTSSSEMELMVESCTTLVAYLFGEDNWLRWNQIKQQTKYFDDFQAFLSWLLDIAESELQPIESATNITSNELSEISEISKDRDTEQPNCQIKPSVNGSFPNNSNSSDSVDMVDVDYDHTSNVFYCRPCQLPLANTIETSQHLANTHHTSSGTPSLTLHCSCCLTSYPSMPNYLSAHPSLSHPISNSTSNRSGGGGKLACEHCFKTFSNRFCLKEHMQNKHDVTKRPGHMCNACGKKFAYASGLSRHKSTCHLRVRQDEEVGVTLLAGDGYDQQQQQIVNELG